jgi:hypothetical protein
MEEATFAVPEEPAPPEPGSAARRPYLEAMVAGDQRALDLAGKGLADARVDPGGVSPAYVERLQSMQRIYQERLARHRDALTR